MGKNEDNFHKVRQYLANQNRIIFVIPRTAIGAYTLRLQGTNGQRIIIEAIPEIAENSFEKEWKAFVNDSVGYR
jgi:hypothetical protein